MNTRDIDILQGKSIVNGLSAKDCKTLFKYIGELESILDEGDMEDAFGTEGWRARFQ